MFRVGGLTREKPFDQFRERRLLGESFSTVNFDNVLLLQEGRKPVSPTGYLGSMGGGAIAVLIGLAGAYKGFTESA